jgi:hypothetical protein
MVGTRASLWLEWTVTDGASGQQSVLQQPVAVGPDGPGRFFAVAHAKIFPTDLLFALNRPCMIVSWQMFDSGATFRFRLQKIRHGFPLKLKQR